MAGGEELKSLASAFDSPTFGKDGSFRLDEPVGSASISPCGRDVVLASRQGLHIIDLDSPYSPPRHLPHRTPWEVADVQWSPFASRDYWVVSTSNQKALVWNLAMISSQASIEHVLHAHTRAITDINFSAHHPDVLATCAVDSFVHCWDLRHPARPAVTFCDWFAGATQVKWNRQESHILASSHNKFLRIWDDRKGAYPLKSIEAHATKIYGVDWNRTATNNLVTCSLDRTIKFWDYTKHDDKPDRTIATPFPVWRARYTPFGSGLLAMPQRGDHDLHLYDYGLDEDVGTKISMPQTSVYQFSGHNDRVKEFLWRFRGTIGGDIDNREFQLVSWGTDRNLRLHRVGDDVLDSVGYRQGMKVKTKLNFTRRNATYKTFRDRPETFDTKSRKISSVAGMFDHDEGVDPRYSGGLSFAMTQAAMPTRVGWGNEGFIRSVAGRKVKPSGEMDAISWMRGVRIGKRDTTPSGMDQSLASVLSPELKADKSWDTFESLGEEISHIGDKFGKVGFEKVDMQNRTVIVSFSGPWGSDSSNIHMKCRVEFPTKYPSAAAPKFEFEHTTLISHESLTHVCVGVKMIAKRYMIQQKSSLEASLRYLLGEQDLEESLGWLEQRRESNNMDLVQDPALSSSDEDEELGGNTRLRVQALDMSDGTIAVSNAQYNVPLPKACGAMWADDGRLVCFFPPKEDKTHSLLDSLTLRTSDRSSKSRKTIFEGFGRMHNGSIIPTRLISPLKTLKDGDSDSSRSSSGSSSSSEGDGVLRHHFLPSMAWRGSLAETQDVLSVDDSYKSSGGAGFTTSACTTNNYVAIHNCSNLLPSKRSLAHSYVVSGVGSDCCEVNARVAEESGDPDLAAIWVLLQLLLKNEVPLEMMQHPFLGENAEPIMVVARRIVSPLKSRDSAVDLTFDLVEENMRTNTRGSIKWGTHPFGRRWLIDSLFQHFERLADIQMLAMLSCVLSETLLAKRSMTVVESENQQLQSQNKRSASHSVGDWNDTMVGYFPSYEVAKNLLRPATPKLSGSHKRVSGPHSTSSSVGATISDPMTPFSTGATPPNVHHPSATSFEKTDPLGSTILISSEYQRSTQRSSSNLASTFAASLSRPFSFSASVSSSPPATYPRKRSSPAGSYIGAPPTGVTWGATSFFTKSSTTTEDPKYVNSLSVSDTEEGIAIPNVPVFTTKLRNQDQFGNEGYADRSLVDPAQSWQYHAYRELYAHMLIVWEMPLARCELLKYNHQPPSVPGSPPKLVPRLSSPIAIGSSNVESLCAGEEPGARLGFVNCHTTFTSQVSQHHKVQRSAYCTGPASSLICLLCAEIIRGLSSPCLACGHVLHASCRSIMLSQVTLATENGLCISGCGCRCTDHIIVEVETPLVSQISPSPTCIGDTSIEQAQYTSQGEAQIEGDTWEDIAREHVAYESLARVRERYITPKPSQIWRGEERKNTRLAATRKESY